MDGTREKAVLSAVLTLKELGEMLLRHAESEAITKVIKIAIDRPLRPTSSKEVWDRAHITLSRTLSPTRAGGRQRPSPHPDRHLAGLYMRATSRMHCGT